MSAAAEGVRVPWYGARRWFRPGPFPRRGGFEYGPEGMAMAHGGRGFGPGPGHGHGPGGFRGGPWFGGRGGPFWGPGMMFRRGGRAGRGDVRAAALALLAEEPLHGYQLMQRIAERSRGVWRPSPGSVYPALQQLEDEGLVRAEKAEGKRVFHLTEAGRAYVDERREELAAVWESVGDETGEGMVELGGLVMQVGAATMQVVHAGSEAQVAEAKRLLTNTRRQLYRILAEDDPDEREAGEDAES